MPQYDVYRYDNETLFVQVQHDIVDFFDTAIVIPLSSKNVIGRERLIRLNPDITINGDVYILRTQEMAPVSRRALPLPIANIADHHYDITAAIDFLFHGF